MSALSFMIVLSPSTSSPPAEGEQQAVLLTVAGMTIGDVSNWRHFLNSYLKWLSWMSLSLNGNSQENYRGCFFCCCCCCLFYLFYGFLIVRNISLRWNYSYICETYFFTIFIKLVFLPPLWSLWKHTDFGHVILRHRCGTRILKWRL